MSSEGTPLHGDRSAWNVLDFDTEHGKDIDDSTLRRHLPLPGADGGYARSDGTDWQRVSSIALADLADYTINFIIVGGGSDWVAAAFDWDTMAAGSGADMVHSHTSNAEGGNIAVAAISDIATTYLKLDASNDPITGDLTLTPSSNSTSTLDVNQSDGTAVLDVDTTNRRVVVTSGATGQSTIEAGLVVNNASGGGAIDDTQINSDTLTAILVDASADTMVFGIPIADKIMFTQADGNEYIDSLADGYMDYGATTAHRFNNDIVLPKTSGKGIKIDNTTPTFGWRDLKGKITNSKGATKPSEVTYRDGITQFQFSAGDDAELEFHIPHDYVPGTDVHLHVHWSHNSGSVTGGEIILTYEITYAKGHNRGAFPQSVTGTITGTASSTQYQHIVSEGEISTSGGDTDKIDTDDLEPDGLILCRIEMTTNNMTGATPDPFLHEVDVHYQTTNLGTKQKAPDFYT